MWRPWKENLEKSLIFVVPGRETKQLQLQDKTKRKFYSLALAVAVGKQEQLKIEFLSVLELI